MQSKHAILALLVMASALASGCVQSPPSNQGGGEIIPQDEGGEQQPPADVLAPGAWSRVALTTTSAKPVEFTYKSVEVSVDGVPFSGIETETSTTNTLVIWEKGKDPGALSTRAYSLSKMGQLTLCNEFSGDIRSIPLVSDPYLNDTGAYAGTGTYATSSGRTVGFRKYRISAPDMKAEYWYSAEVPFVLVRSETNTTVVGKEVTSKMELRDFGTGAVTNFIGKDFEKCK